MFDLMFVILGFMLKCFLFLVVPFLVLFAFWIVYFRTKGYRFKKGLYKNVGHGSFLKRLFYLFPKRYILDLYERDPDHFREFGVHIVAGKQGSGKTITVVYLLLMFKKMYPRLVIKTNMAYKHEDSAINHWKDIVASTNGIYGEINVVDEIQNWFNSLQSKDFPVEMLTEITQQRKQAKIIIGTTQVFTRTAKPIREQTYLLYQPFTLFGCVTLVMKQEPILDDSGCVLKNKLRGFFFFVHNEEIRNAFDTYKKIQKYSEQGFKDDSLHIGKTEISVKSDLTGIKIAK